MLCNQIHSKLPQPTSLCNNTQRGLRDGVEPSSEAKQSKFFCLAFGVCSDTQTILALTPGVLPGRVHQCHAPPPTPDLTLGSQDHLVPKAPCTFPQIGRNLLERTKVSLGGMPSVSLQVLPPEPGLRVGESQQLWR